MYIGNKMFSPVYIALFGHGSGKYACFIPQGCYFFIAEYLAAMLL